MGKTHITEVKKINGLFHHIYCSGAATLVAHPARVFLNRASMYQWPIATIIESRPYLLKGIGFNLLRGTLATGLQSYSKQVVQEHAGLIGGVFAAAFCGALVATCIETPFIRQSISQTAGSTYSLWRFSPTLSSLYVLRELGFSLAVLSPESQYGTLLGAALATAVTHKFAALEAVRDTLPPNKSIPDFRQGILYTIRSMARGDVYTHPVFRVPFKNPQHILAMTGNLFHVSCGVNMYVFRLLYLGVFKEAYRFATSVDSSISAPRSGFFSKLKWHEIPERDSAEVLDKYLLSME